MDGSVRRLAAASTPVDITFGRLRPPGPLKRLPRRFQGRHTSLFGQPPRLPAPSQSGAGFDNPTAQFKGRTA